MTRDQLLKEVLQLPAGDRLHLVEAIWDSIAASPEQLPVPEWHRAELDRRLADTAPEHVTWEQIQGRLKQAS